MGLEPNPYAANGNWLNLQSRYDMDMAKDELGEQVAREVRCFPAADIIRMRNGKIVEFFEFYDTAKAIEGSR